MRFCGCHEFSDDQDNALIRVNLRTDNRSADPLEYVAGDQALRMTHDDANGRMLVLAESTSTSGDYSIQAVDHSSYQVTELSSFGNGPVLQSLKDLALDVANNRLLLLDSGLGALLKLDLDTG
jgi:hypothetical protein